MSCMPKVVELSGQLFKLKPADTIAEVNSVQRLDTETWPDGYKHYAALFDLDQNSIFVATDQSEDIASYVGVERIRDTDFKKGIPGWDHDSREFSHMEGKAWYITGHVVNPKYAKVGLSASMIDYLKEAAVALDIDQIAVVLRINHPTLGKASRFWEKHDFTKLENTYDPNWKASPNAEDSGGVIYSFKLHPAKI